MTSSKHISWKQIFAIVAVLAVAFVGVEMYRAFTGGVRDLKSIITAPWTAAKSLWNSITGFAGALVAPSPTSSPAALERSMGVDPNSPLGAFLSGPAQDAINQANLGIVQLSTPTVPPASTPFQNWFAQ